MKKKGIALCPNVQKLMQDLFTKAVDYRTFCLKSNSEQYNIEIESKSQKWGDVCGCSRKNEFRHGGSNPHISVLKVFHEACDSIVVLEVVATRLFLNFMKIPALSSLEAPLSSKSLCVKRHHDELLPSYVEVVRYPSAKRATNNIFSRQ